MLNTIKIPAIIIILFSLLNSWSLYVSGGTTDSQVYYDFHNKLTELGVVDGLASIFIITGKFEPVQYLWLHFINLALPADFFVFLLTAFLTIYGFLYYALSSIFGASNSHTKYYAMTLFWYPCFINTLWFWRATIALCFLLLYISSDTRYRKYFILALGILTHNTIILFYIIYLLSKKIVYFADNYKKNFSYTVLIFSPIVVIMILYIFLENYLQVNFASGGDVESWTLDATSSTGLYILIYLTLVFLFLFPLLKKVTFINAKPLYVFCLVLLCLAWIHPENHNLIIRMTGCVTMIAIPLSIKLAEVQHRNKLEFRIFKSVILTVFLFGSLQTFILMYKLISGRLSLGY